MASLKEMYADFENGTYLAELKLSMVEGYRFAGNFPLSKVDNKQVTIVQSDSIDKFLTQTGKSKKLAKGASARKIRGEVITPSGFKLAHNEIQYTISNEDMEHPSFNLMDEISAMGYVFANDLDEIVYKTAKDNATLVTDSKIIGEWGEAATEFKSLVRDVIRFQSNIRPLPYNINMIAYGSEADVELKARAGQSVSNYTLPQNGFTVKDALDLANAKNFWGGRNFSDGESIGFDRDVPALDVIMMKYKNPKIKSMPTIQGMESLLPPVNMLMFDNADTETEPMTTIKVACTAGAYPRAKGERMIRFPDFVS
jgi:hypothetical protein